MSKKKKNNDEFLASVIDIVTEMNKPKKVKRKKEKTDKVEKVESKLNGFEVNEIIEIPTEDVNFTKSYSINSFGVENDRLYAKLNKVTTTGKIDKRYKEVKKFFDETNFLKINTFKKGDKVFLDKRGRILWENVDYTTQLKKNFFYTVRSITYTDCVYVTLEETTLVIHPNHFAKKEYEGN